MNYQLATLSPTQIAGMDKLPIERQDAIKDQFGQPLTLSKAYYLLRDATSNFTQPGSEAARQLDAALYGLLEKKGFFGQKNPPVEILRTRLDTGKKDTITPSAGQSGQIIIARPGTPAQPKRVSFTDYPLAAKFMPKHQKNLVQNYEDDDKRQILEGIEANLRKLGDYRSQDGLGDKAMVYAHYFWGQTDHFITETDFEDGGENLFGFTILNGDTQYAELGSIALRDLTENGRVELDFYWTPVTLGEAKAKAYPEEWGGSVKEEEETRTGKEILESLEGIAPIQVVLNAERQIAYNENEEDNDQFLNLRNLAIWAKEVPEAVDTALEWLEARMEQDTGITGDARAVNDRLGEILRPMKEVAVDEQTTDEAPAEIPMPPLVEFLFGASINKDIIKGQRVTVIVKGNSLTDEGEELLELLGFKERDSKYRRYAPEVFEGKLSIALKTRMIQFLYDQEGTVEQKRELAEKIAAAPSAEALHTLAFPRFRRADLSKYRPPQPELKKVKTPYFSYIVDDQVLLSTEYNPDVVAAARKLNGKWDGYGKVWAFDLRDLDRMKEALRNIFGTDGDDTPDVVDVKVFLDNVPGKAYTNNYGHAVFALGRQLAHRKYRDSRVILGDNVTILEGGFPSGGGSAKNPRLDEKSGTVLLVRDVPSKVVESDELWCTECYEIVGEEKPKPVEEIPATVAEIPTITGTLKGKPLAFKPGDTAIFSNNRGEEWEGESVSIISAQQSLGANEYTVRLGTGEVLDVTEWDLKPVSPLRILGRKRAITLPNGEKHNAQFAIVELDDIRASHNEETFGDTPGYPRNAQGQNLNDRNYSGDKAAQQLVEEYARNLNPDLLIALTSTPEGTPIITPNGIVVSGNNRTMSLKLARKKYPERWKAYQEALGMDLDVFGLDDFEMSKNDQPSLQDQMKAPVLVRIDYDFGDLTTTNMAKYNASSMKGKRPLDRSRELSAKLVENALCGTNIPQIIGRFDTLSDFYADRNAQKQIRDQLIGCNLVTQQEMPAYYDAETGYFNDEGKTFIERTLAAAVLTADALQAADTEGVKRLRAAIVNALPALLQNKGLQQGSLIAAVNEAILFQQKMVASKLSFSDFLAQKSMFDTQGHSQQAVVLARLMLSGQKAFKSALVRYNDSVAANTGDLLFAAEVVSPGDAFERIIFAALPKEDQSIIRSWESLSDEIEQIRSNPSTMATRQDDTATAPAPAEPGMAEKLALYRQRVKLLTLSLKKADNTAQKTYQQRIKLLNKFIERHTAA